MTTRKRAGSFEWEKRYWRATNYLAASMIYLKDNFLLERPLKPEDIKPSLLGHWGTCPGINFVHTHLNALIVEHDLDVLLLTGPGHGFAANLANMFMDGSLEEVYPEYQRSKAGMGNLLKAFCWPGGFPSHLNPGVPGCIHEGGELGYALATAFGAVFDNPDLIAVAIVGDGEAETGPTATAWHSNKFLDPKTCGAVLPILHRNGFKINSPTISGAMSEQELEHLYKGYGYQPRFVGPDHKELHDTMEWAIKEIHGIQSKARSGKKVERPAWPMIVLTTPKGWSGIKTHNGHKIEGSWRSHQVPLTDPRTNQTSLKELEAWLRSYKPKELFPKGELDPSLIEKLPKGPRRVGSNPHAIGGNLRKLLDIPAPENYAQRFSRRGASEASSMEVAGGYLRDICAHNQNFRIFSPDELASNKLDKVLEVTGRQFVWPHKGDEAHLQASGNVLEMLSEHTLQAWMQGYVLTGRHGLFPSYEAFLPIVDSMVSQYLKFIEMSQGFKWRQPVSSLNYILTSVCWRQDHNGFSHQNPGFINTLLNKAKEERLVRVYLPADANMLLTVLDHSLRATDRVNVIVADKRPIKQWLTYEEARNQARLGAGVWEFASDPDPDVVLAAAGDYQTQECLAAIQLLKDLVPQIKVRFVNVNELNVLGRSTFSPNGLHTGDFERLFPQDLQVIFTFHGYPGAIKQLLFDRPGNERFHIYGYIEKGTTTTPFDMLVRNNVSRYHLALRAIKHAAKRNPSVAAKQQLLTATFESLIYEHKTYILEHGCDPKEVTHWRWKGK